MMGHFRVLPQDAGIMDGMASNEMMRVAPNPVTTFLDITADPSLGVGDIIITDLTGRVVMMHKSVAGLLRLDVQQCVPGSYVVTFRSAVGTSSVRFVRA